MTRLTKFIQWGLLVLVALMPFHAFFSVALGHAFGHQALIQSWKEVLLLLLLTAAAVLIIREPARLQRLHRPWPIAALALVGLSLIIALTRHSSIAAAAFGLKTDIEFLAAALLALVVTDQRFTNHLARIVIGGAALVAGFDLLQIFILPPDFLVHFGYGPTTILPYQHIATGTSFLRFPATLGGPNQLGTYLILPLALSVALFIRRRQPWYLVLFAACLISLIWTFSRSAWIGAAAAIILTLIVVLPHRARRSAALISGLILIGVLLILPFALAKGGALQYFVLHSSVSAHDQTAGSDSQHAMSLHNGLTALAAKPFGHGLATAGPSTFHVGTTNIIEDYYLQIGYEMGIVAVLLFLFIVAALIRNLLKFASHQPVGLATAAAVAGISIVALVLPSWTDSTTALITWICAGALAESHRV